MLHSYLCDTDIQQRTLILIKPVIVYKFYIGLALNLGDLRFRLRPKSLTYIDHQISKTWCNDKHSTDKCLYFQYQGNRY